MDHEQIRELIQPYADGELDAANAGRVEQHLRACADCRSNEQRIRALRDTLARTAPAYRASKRLRSNVRAALRREAKTDSFSPWMIFATGAVCALLLLAFAFFQTSRASHDAIVDQVVANHVRSLLADHLVDVASSDQHTVKPWFDGKIDFAPAVRDLTNDGFPLAGGRLDYLDGKTVVALVYHRAKHPINLFIAPAPGHRDESTNTITRRGYNLVHWMRGEMDYWAVSDLNADELRQFAAKF
jgi:anti-sigma factor RsiW